MKKVSFHKKIKIAADYICETMELPTEVRDRAIGYFLLLNIDKTTNIPLPILVHFIIMCIFLSKKIHEWKSNEDDYELSEEVMEISTILAKRIHEYETACQ